MDIMQEQMGGINRKTEILRPKNECKKNTLTKKKSAFDELISSLDTAEECLWDRWYINTTIKSKKAKIKRMKKEKIEKNIQGWCFCWCCSVTESCSTLCNSMDCSMPGSPVFHYLPEFPQTHVLWVRDAIQPSHPVTPLSACPQSYLALRPFPVLEFQLQHWSFQWIFRIGFL